MDWEKAVAVVLGVAVALIAFLGTIVVEEMIETKENVYFHCGWHQSKDACLY